MLGILILLLLILICAQAASYKLQQKILVLAMLVWWRLPPNPDKDRKAGSG